ncbi:LysR family transcriptional regulator [Kutzneria sp. NPDC052558]|uniref:LysR family transcriptional regulator n=1 Tax=Kutzneria sp. NPDC052558 TaxID=3364121 RepID=UPI0037CB20A1
MTGDADAALCHTAAVELRHLRYFLSVAETLNFSRAAETLHMASSPLSRAIRQLEVELGGPLFDRSTRSVTLTSLGEALVPRAQHMLTEHDGLVRDMRRRASGRREILLGMRSIPPAMARTIVDDVVRIAEPDAIVRLQPLLSLSQLEEILRGRMTFGLVNRRIQDPRLRYLLALRETAAIALPAREPYLSLTHVRPEHLAGLQLLVVQGYTEYSDEPGRSYEDAAAGRIVVDNQIPGGIAALIANGDACCFTYANPDAPWHRNLTRDGVVIRLLPPGTPGADTYLAWRADRETDDDLGPTIEVARHRFATPLEL